MPAIQRYLDAAILKPEFTQAEVRAAIQACIEMETFSVCVRPCDIPLAQSLCQGSQTAVCVVLGFPHGVQLTQTKLAEAREYIALGVDEIDMVANYGWAKSGNWQALQAEIQSIAQLCQPAEVVLKVIFETAQLEPATIRQLVEICVTAGADFVKTSTGFNGAGASEADVQLMLATAAGRIQVKPSGGIRDAASARHFIELGATRLGVGWTACQAICSGDTNHAPEEMY
jgi:deoxyribose-phosphate aldolase